MTTLDLEKKDEMKLDIRYKRYINTAFIIGPMTMLMALVGVIRNYGFHEGWFLKTIFTWLTMFPIAYVFAFFIIPMGNRLTNRIPFEERSSGSSKKKETGESPAKLSESEIRLLTF